MRELQAENRRLRAAAKKSEAHVNDDDVGEDGDEDAAAAGDPLSPEWLDYQVVVGERNLAYAKECLEDLRKKGWPTGAAQQTFDEAEATLEARKQAVRDSKDPEEQVEKKTARQKQLRDK